MTEQVWPEVPELVEVYDIENAGRWDHDFYLALAEELGVGSVLDVGCGTGVFAIDAAARGWQATGVDPAAASLDLASTRPGGDTVTWLHGGVELVADRSVDLVVMMGHVAQYFIEDDAWAEVLIQVERVLASGGHLAFETRNPVIDWASQWVRDRTTGTYPHPRGGEFTAWTNTEAVTGPPDSYSLTHRAVTLLPDGREFQASETLRFRNPGEIETTLAAAGLTIEASWGDWDRSPFDPDHSRELIVLAGRS